MVQLFTVGLCRQPYGLAEARAAFLTRFVVQSLACLLGESIRTFDGSDGIIVRGDVWCLLGGIDFSVAPLKCIDSMVLLVVPALKVLVVKC